MLKLNLVILKLTVLTALTLASAALSAADWQRPDCTGYDKESACIHAFRNEYRQQKQLEFKEKGLSFWYYERPDFKGDKAVEEALQNKLEGRVTVQFDIDASGETHSVKVKQLSSDAMQVYAPVLLTAVENWQFISPQEMMPLQEWSFTFLFPVDENVNADEPEAE